MNQENDKNLFIHNLQIVINNWLIKQTAKEIGHDHNDLSKNLIKSITFISEATIKFSLF